MDFKEAQTIYKDSLPYAAELNRKCIYAIDEVWGRKAVMEDNMMIAGFQSCFLGYMDASIRGLSIWMNDFDDFYMSAEFKGAGEVETAWQTLRRAGCFTEKIKKSWGFKLD